MIRFISYFAASAIFGSIAIAQPSKPETRLLTEFSGHPMADRTNALPAAESARLFTVPDDLEMELVLAEPIVTQPVFLNFDERGRMWVIQYLQYPAPAGLKPVSRDNFWRAVYDKVPEPPPRGVKGLDQITIHEDTDGDGSYDKHKTFVDGLNIATACARGRGGVWVLNPPYLLFYPDKNDDDVPDADPVVHLQGFGLEDTHSVVNSLRWGPDGWLYAAQGSTVTANVRVVAAGSPDTNTVHYSQGQNIWRYHPESKRYEIFAEGGGNAFGVEMDDHGRIFSGHNGGDTRGFHYMQGAYLRKGFEKHGELANPYAFGYFPQMDGTRGERFTHNFIIYHGDALPARYDGKLFGIEPLQGRVVLSDITPVGSTFKTRDIERVVTSRDSWFRPVDIKVGPDGAIYLADWHDRQVTHTRNQEGFIDKDHGRIYRLKRKAAKAIPPFNLATLPSSQLVENLRHTNLWFRETALRLIADRRDRSIVPALRKWIETSREPVSLDALWALHQLKQPLTPGLVSAAVKQRNEPVLTWMIRLLGDDTKQITPATSMLLLGLASSQTNVELRAQIAATARRLPAPAAVAIVAALSRRAEDVEDPRIPLLCWWALESKCESDRDAVLKLFSNSPVWFLPVVEQHILSRLMRRYAATGSRQDLLTCARLFELAPDASHARRLMKGFEEAYAGRPLTGLPEELITAMKKHNVASETLKLRSAEPSAIRRALEVIANPKESTKDRVERISVLGELRIPAALDSLLTLAADPKNPAVQKAALGALAGYDDPRVAKVVIRRYETFTPELRSAALNLIGSRATWALEFAKAVEAKGISASDVPLENVRRMKLHTNSNLAGLIARLWPRAGAATTAEMQTTIEKLSTVVRNGNGNPYAGQTLFNTYCASCHTLFARGGKVGPDLTTYQRGDLDTMLLHIVNPSAEIREGYENMLIETKDDRSLTGFLVERDARLVVLRGPDGQNVLIEQSNIAEMKAAGMSLMPEGLLDSLNDQQVRDLFAYLRSTQPLAN